MSKAFKSVKKLVKKALPVAAAVAGNYFGGPLGAAVANGLSTKLQGGSWGDALMSGGMSALGSGIFGGTPSSTGFSGIDSINSGIRNFVSPLRTLGQSVGNSFSGALKDSPLGSLVESNLSTDGTAPGIEKIGVTDVGPIGSYSNSAASSPSENSFWDKLLESAKEDPLRAISSGSMILQSLFPTTYAGGTTQEDIKRQMQAQSEEQKAQNAKFIESLNSPTFDRQQTTTPIDYYHYGERPEQQFFEDVNPRINFAKGGRVAKKKSGSPLATIGGKGGQDDSIKANLSEGEYVIPADVVSNLGDGNTRAGGKQLDKLVKKTRKQKAPAMKKGVLPPRAKSPLAYIGAN